MTRTLRFFLTTMLGWLLAAALCPARPAWAESTSGSSEPWPPLRVGDVLLLELSCYSCQAISAATGSPYNHSGLVVAFSESLEPMVAQALGTVEAVPLGVFLAQAPKGARLMLRRSLELDQLYREHRGEYARRAFAMQEHFASAFAGQEFDAAFLWDNRDADGRELLYCSELVQKTLNHGLVQPLPPVAMDFTVQAEFWHRYFRGRVPQGLPGNSPASLEQSLLLKTMWRGRLSSR